MTRLQSILSKVKCKIFGHKYYPYFSMCTVISERRVLRKEYQYTCKVCLQKTSWMKLEDHVKFVIKNTPTWGSTGGDSQGYKKMSHDEIRKAIR